MKKLVFNKLNLFFSLYSVLTNPQILKFSNHSLHSPAGVVVHSLFAAAAFTAACGASSGAQDG